MSNQWNVVYVDMEADLTKFEKWLNQSLKIARDTWKELSQELLLKLEMDYSELKVAKFEAQQTLSTLRKEYKEWLVDRSKLVEAENSFKRITSELTQSQRVLENYKNTWDTATSRLQAKFNQVTDEIKKSRDELIKVWKSTSSIDEIIKKADQLQKEFKEGTITLQDYTKQLQNLKNQATWSIAIFDKVKSWLWGIATFAWGVSIWAWLFSIWKQALFLWDKLEQASISFETMTWSAEIAKQLLEDLAIFASNTPFELIWLRDTAKQLLAFGIDVKDIIPTLKALWDVSAWLSVPIEQVAYAYWQVKVAWRLMWWELMQFTNAWVPMIEYLSKVMWVAQKDIKEMVSEGKVWFSDVQKAFKLMTSEWERFWNLMDKQTTTLWWMWSNLKDKASSLLEDFWTDIIPFAKKIVSAMSFALTWVNNLYNWFKIAFNFIDWIVWYTILSITNKFHKLFEFFKNIQENFWILGDNIWLAFSNIPWTIAKYLDKWIEAMENFINSNIAWINKLSKALWMDWLWKVSFWRIWDKFWWQPEFKKFNLWIASDLEDSWAKYFKKQMDDILKIVEDWNETQKKLDTELNILEQENDNETTKNSKNNQKELEKLKKEEEKKEKEREERFQDFLKNKAKKTLETTKETYERLSDYLKDNINKFEKNIDDFDKAIKKSQESIDDLSEDLKKLESWKSWDLSNRYLWTEDDIEKLKAEIKKLEQEWVSLRDAESYWLSTLKQIWTWFLWNNSVEDLIEILEKQKELNDLIKEQNLLKANLSQDEIDEALRKDWLSETEKILEEYEAEKESLNQQIQLEKEYIEEVQWLRDIEIENLENFNEIKENLDLKYADFAMQLEAKITQQQYEQLSTREANLNASIDRQISKLNEMIRIANNAWISLAWTNLWDSTLKSTSSWSSNTTIVNNTFNQNISDNIDMNRVNKEIVNTMNSNSKWMSWRTI